MCGISGVFSFDGNGKQYEEYTLQAVEKLKLRGPDFNNTYANDAVSLGHTRLSIIDTSSAGNQPFISSDGEIAIVFNGEFYNYKDFRNELVSDGFEFRSNSDTEVLLNLYRKHGIDVLKYINGCFAIAIWDKNKQTLFIARDRIGINPVYYYRNDKFLAFASEMKGLLEYPIPREINTASLYSYFQLNYIPDHHTMLKNIKKLEPGTYIEITEKCVTEKKFYNIPDPSNQATLNLSYQEAQIELKKRLNRAVEQRMISDVPLGAFLSGGIDSSIIVALASQYTNKLNTFSIGFKDEPFFDETSHAELLAKKYNTNHTSFSLTNDELFEDLNNVLDYIDEPFADSSALAVHILSQHTKKHVTVALSGDGADEMFSGYNKHLAHQKALENNLRNSLIKNSYSIWKALPKSRQGKFSNTIRQLERYSNGLKLDSDERYWSWCSLSNEKSISKLIKTDIDKNQYYHRKENLLQHIKSNPNDMQAVLYSDMKIVLCQDMLMKVDLMSMGNSLEVRTPFLDHNVVDFAFKLPMEYKMQGGIKKRILRDSFRNEIPAELLKRPKHGFEVPLLNWFKNDLSDYLEKEIFNEEFIEEQGIFEIKAIRQIKQQLNSQNPGDIHARIWALLVFQSWWKKTMN